MSSVVHLLAWSYMRYLLITLPVWSSVSDVPVEHYGCFFLTSSFLESWPGSDPRMFDCTLFAHFWICLKWSLSCGLRRPDLYIMCVWVCVGVLRGAVLISLLERKPGSQIHPLCLQENICSSFVPSLLVFIPSSGTHSQSVCSSPSVLFLSNQMFCQIMLSTFMCLFI